MSTHTLDLAIAALRSSHADLVAKEEQRVAASKGKARATQEDETRDAEYRNQLEKHNAALDELVEAREKQSRDEEAKAAKTYISDLPNHEYSDGKRAKSPQDATDKDPYLNPFTGSYVYPETGFEPGPSSTSQVSDVNHHILVPPPAYSLEDQLNSSTLQDSSHQMPPQVDYPNVEVAYKKPEDGRRRQEVTNDDSRSKASEPNVKPFILRGIGSMVSAFESWIHPRINTALHGSSVLPKFGIASQNHEKLPGERLEELGEFSMTTDSLHSMPCGGTSSTETLQSTSTPPSSICLEHSRASRRPPNYRPNVPNIEERDEGPPLLSSENLNGTVERFPALLPAISKASQSRDSDDPSVLSNTNPTEFAAGKTNGGAESVSEYVADDLLLEDLDKAAQMQIECELADQEAAAEAQRSYEQLVQMQREFDEECTRLRADRELALAYTRDIEEAMRVDEILREEEALLRKDLELAQQLESQFSKEEDDRKKDLEAAAILARGLEEVNAVIDADTALATRLMEEEMAVQNDRAFAERLQADVEREEAHATKFYQSDSTNDPNQTNAGELDSQTLPYRRFPSLENIRGSASVNSNARFNADNIQQPEAAVRSDRAFAQAIFTKEQIRYSEAKERWERDIQAWSETKETKSKAVADRHARQEKVRGQASRMATERPEVIAARVSVEKDVANCALCVDSFPKSQLVRPCNDFYCRPCLADWFQRALREKPKKQPRCCNRILPVSLVSNQLGEKFMVSWRLFELETTTPNPLFCSNRKCAKFVPPYDIHGDTGTCSCTTRTCRHCRNRSHPGKLCAQDEDTQKVKALGKKQGWRYCPKCKHLIERTEGCLHMVCSQCRTEFCWKCGKTTCKGVGACKGGMEYYQ